MEKLRLGVSGLGRGAMLTLPGLAAHARIEVAAAYDPSEAARNGFYAAHGGAVHKSFEELCADGSLDALYIASPHEAHAQQAVAAAHSGKHVLVEKPMTLHLSDAAKMITAAKEANIVLMVGPSHGYDPPIALARTLIDSGRYGRVRMVKTFNYTDFLYRPRRPEELDPSRGGGVVLSQATHQIDIVRRLIGPSVGSVRARVSCWDPTRGSDGAYSALLFFEDGAWASLTYSGYGRWDSDILAEGVNEFGGAKPPATERRAPVDEARAKQARGFAGINGQATLVPPSHHEHFGFLLVSCDGADLEVTPDGVIAHWRGGALEQHRAPLPSAQRYAVAEALVDAVLEGKQPIFDGEWGRQTLACCHAILQSSAQEREVRPADLVTLAKESKS